MCLQERKITRDKLLAIHNMSEQCVDKIMKMLSDDVIIDECVYRLYDDEYHMIKVADNSVLEVNIPQIN